jgi:hypothetical protein
MNTFILWCGFVGAWALFAGPVHQAALELGEEEFDRDQFRSISASYTPPPRVSPWWWLVPPIGYVLQHRRSDRVRREMMALLTPEQIAGYLSYTNKATGWVFVAVGGLLLATKETWELAEHYEWPVYVFWLGAVAMALVCALYTAASLGRSKQLLGAQS